MDLGTLTTQHNFSDSASPGDVDFLKFQLNEISTFTATISGITGGARVNVALVLDLNGNNVADPGETLESQNAISTTFTMDEPVSDGAYFLQITPSGATSGAYTLAFSATAIPEAVDAGDSLASARDVGILSESMSNFVDVIQQGDVDADRIILADISDLTATLTGVTESMTVTLLRDLNGNSQLDTGENLEGISISSATTLNEPLSAGTYFLQIEPLSFSSIKVTCEPRFLP